MHFVAPPLMRGKTSRTRVDRGTDQLINYERAETVGFIVTSLASSSLGFPVVAKS